MEYKSFYQISLSISSLTSSTHNLSTENTHAWNKTNSQHPESITEREYIEYKRALNRLHCYSRFKAKQHNAMVIFYIFKPFPSICHAAARTSQGCHSRVNAQRNQSLTPYITETNQNLLATVNNSMHSPSFVFGSNSMQML